MTIDEEALRKAFADVLRRLSTLETFTGMYVPDQDLDNPRRQLKVHFDARDWKGPSCKGKLARDCPPAFLDAYAGALQFMGENPKEQTDEARKRARYNIVDAARARSWARRLRTQQASPPAPAPLSPDEKRELFDDGEEPDSERPSGDSGVFDDEDDDALFPD